MLILKQETSKKLLFLSGILLLAGFLFFLPEKAYASDPVFTAGWYQDHGGTKDNPCEKETQWQGHIEFRNAADSLMPLHPIDELEVEVLWYKNDNTVERLFREEIRPLDRSVYKTGCIEIKGDKDKETIVLRVRAVKNGFYTMVAANSPMKAGDTLSQATWKKTLYLAPTDPGEWEYPNIAFTFPVNGQWVSNKEEYDQMELFVSKAPEEEAINEIKVEIKHTGTAKIFTPNIDIGAGITAPTSTVRLNKPLFEDLGEYTWRITSMKSGPNLFYNENAVSKFNFDPHPPTFDRRRGYGLRSGKLQAPYIYVAFKDEPVPSSGMHKIELYLNDGPDTPLELVSTCTRSSPVTRDVCSYVGTYEEYLVSKTYTYYAIGYDFVGNETKIAEHSFTISQISPSYLNIRSRVNDSSVTGVPFEVIDVYNVVGEGDAPATGTYATNKEFEGTVDRYTITLEAPESHNDRPFSYWQFSSFCDEDPLSRQVEYSYTSTLTMYFGASRLVMGQRGITNRGLMSSDLSTKINQITTRIEQIGGTPSNFLSPEGYIDIGSQYFFKTVTEEINDLRLRFHDSENDILKFSHFTGDFCQIIEGRECQGSLIYKCGRVNRRYAIKRTVRVETYLGVNPVGEVVIEGSGGMKSGTTTADGYYEFSSTARSVDFSGTLRAASTITVGGEEFAFGEWRGCESVSEDGLGCYIGTNIWYDSVAPTVEAHYADPGEEPEVNCAEFGIGDEECGPPPDDDPDQITPYYCQGNVARPRCNFPCSCPPGYECVISSDGVCVPLYNLSVGSSPVNGFSVTSSVAGHESFTTTYNMPDILEGTVVSLTVEPEQTIGGDTYHFINWTDDEGTIITTDPTCQVTMDSHKIVRANYSLGPIAAMGCQTGNCLGGPGCECNGNWVTYLYAVYDLLNQSILPDPGVEYTSYWRYNGTEIIFPCTEYGGVASICEASASNIPVGDWTISLLVEDEYGRSSTATQNLAVRRDIRADFKCSLDAEDTVGEDCTTIRPLLGQTVYFVDRSIPSDWGEDAAIAEWTWEKGYMDGGSFIKEEEFGDEETASTVLSSDINTVKLIVKDNHPADAYYPPGRSADTKKSLTFAFFLPKYWEVAPR